MLNAKSLVSSSKGAAAVGIAALLSLLMCATALAIQLKPYSFFAQTNHVTWQISQNGKQLLSFQGYCTPNDKTTKVLVNIFSPIPVNAKGKFSWSKQNAVNTLSGSTLANTSKVTISGQFVSNTKATGSYQIHYPGCKLIKFTARRE